MVRFLLNLEKLCEIYKHSKILYAFSHQKQYLIYSAFHTKYFGYTLLNSGFDFMRKIPEYFVNNLVKKSKF